MKKLKDLQLSIPTIDVLTTRKLMGGDGYVPGDPPEFDYSNALPEFDPDLPPLDPEPEDPNWNDPGDYNGPPIGFETDFDIPDPDMEEIPVEHDRPDLDDERPGSPEDDFDRNNDRDNDYDQDGQNEQNENEPYDHVDNDHQDNMGNKEEDKGNEQDPVEKLVNQLSEKQQAFYNSYNIKIVINPKLGKPGQYDEDDNVITLQNADNLKALFSELVHAYQNYNGILNDASRSNNEYQEHVLADIFNFYDYGLASAFNVLDKDYGAYYDWLDKVTNMGDRSKPINMEAFYEQYDYFYNSFREQYKYSGEGDEIVHAGYSQEPNPEYDWSWEIFMDFLDPAGRSTEDSKL